MRIRRLGATNEALFGTPKLGRAWAGRQGAKQHPGFTWYTKPQWEQLRERADDPEALDDSYEDWLRTAEETVAALSSKGVVVQKVPLNVVSLESGARGRAGHSIAPVGRRSRPSCCGRGPQERERVVEQGDEPDEGTSLEKVDTLVNSGTALLAARLSTKRRRHRPVFKLSIA